MVEFVVTKVASVQGMLCGWLCLRGDFLQQPNPVKPREICREWFGITLEKESQGKRTTVFGDKCVGRRRYIKYLTSARTQALRSLLYRAYPTHWISPEHA